jgi:N-glycosylase/DNA lyase
MIHPSRDMTLRRRVLRLRRTALRQTVEGRLREFRLMQRRSDSAWFSELCFCILAANAKGKNAWRIQQSLGEKKLLNAPLDEVCACIRAHNHRFHNNKAKFIVEAREHGDLKKTISRIAAKGGVLSARAWLIHHIKGIGHKEASHFLRNVGYDGVAILDRHILRLLAEDGLIAKPNTLTPRRYLEIESVFLCLADELSMSPAELDLYLWSMKTGEVLK